MAGAAGRQRLPQSAPGRGDWPGDPRDRRTGAAVAGVDHTIRRLLDPPAAACASLAAGHPACASVFRDAAGGGERVLPTTQQARARSVAAGLWSGAVVMRSAMAFSSSG